MKVFVYPSYDSPPDEAAYDDCILDNRREPVIRKGGELFKTCYPVEWSCFVHHVIDPSRSLAAPVVDWLKNPHDKQTMWPIYDYLSQLLYDLGCRGRPPARTALLFFHTVFPDGTAECLAKSYGKNRHYLEKHADAVRVLNNPWFHKDRNANERRLVEIAEDNGLRFALDRIDPIPPPDVLAREIALLNHGLRDPENVEPVRARLAASIAETMSDWGLVPTV
jgi:hypothetical protein